MNAACPDCGAPLTGAPACPSCGITLQGPVAAQLWQLDQRLAALNDERERLLTVLRSGDRVAAEQPFVFAAGGTRAAADPFAGRPPSRPVLAPLARPEAAPHQVQNTLLTLGALLLAVAGIVFAAVTYQHLGPGGRAFILLAMTLAAGLGAARLQARGLVASAEAITAVAVVLGCLDAWVLRRAGIGDGVDSRSYAAVATLVLALSVAGFSTVVPLRVARLASTVLAQLPMLFALARLEPSRPVVATALAGLAALDLLAASELRWLPQDSRLSLAGLGSLLLVVSLAFSEQSAQEDDRGAAIGLLAVAVVLAAGSARVRDEVLQVVGSALAVLLVAAAGWVGSDRSLTEVQRPLVLAAVALLALTTTGLLALRRRLGPVVGSLLVLGIAVLTQAEGIAVAVAGPFTWLADPWSRTATAARATISVDHAWGGTVVTLVVVAVTATGVVMAALLLERDADAVLPAGALVTLSALLLPLGQAFSYPVSLGVVLAATSAMVAGSWLTTGTVRATLLGGAAALGTWAGLWSVADRSATLVVLPALTVLAALASVWSPLAPGVAALFAGGSVVGLGFARDLGHSQVGGVLLVVPGVCLVASLLLQGTRRITVELAAVVVAAASVGLAADDPTWLSICLGVNGLLALAVAVRPDRHDVGLLGGLLLSASSWVRLADAHVHEPEPYAAPLALTALVFGHLSRRTGNGSSFQAYGAGLTVALVPSLLKSFDDDGAGRGVLLLMVCALVVLAGAFWRLRAPLVIGGGVLVLDALHLLVPYASALPRWSLPAVTGAVLLGVGLTYEQRRQDLARLKARYEQLS